MKPSIGAIGGWSSAHVQSGVDKAMVGNSETDRYSKISTMGPGQALMWGISAKPINTIQYGLAT